MGLSLGLLGLVLPAHAAAAGDGRDGVVPFSFLGQGDPPLRVHGLKRAGTGPIRVVLVPGTPSFVGGWRTTLERGRPDVEWIAVDRPGFGESEPREAVLDFADQIAAIEPLFEAAPGPTILVGHSLGGPLVLRAAAEHPDSIDAVVSLAGSFDPALEEIHPLQRVGRWWGIRHLLPRVLRNSNEELFAHEGELERVSERLAAVRAPVVILHGTNDSLVPYANALYLKERLSPAAAARLITLEGVGHILQRDAVDEVLRAIDLAIEAVGKTR